ncbi:MAG: energy-coupling factor transporter transmembrane protein EcfT [Bacillota bacterium]|nr:energy-coupling factor transporter transmembrane protein EcfT [Bacillota bacterium]
MKINIHPAAAIILVLILTVIDFSTYNVSVILGILSFILAVFIFSGNADKLKKYIYYFVPYAVLTILINLIFVSEGSHVIFQISGKKFTLESLAYALIMSLKLLNVIYIFPLFGVLVDSDDLVSFFSSIAPKSTLTLLISAKIIPRLKKRYESIREVFSLRGVDFSKKRKRDMIKGFLPVIASLTEDTLEGSFEIGEAAFIRGYLGNKRTVYEKKKLDTKDYIILLLSLVLIIFFTWCSMNDYIYFDIYSGLRLNSFFNMYVSINVIIMLIISVVIVF